MNAICVKVDLPFKARNLNELQRQNYFMQKLVRYTEKYYHDIIWYIGADMLGKDLFERFTFNKEGFMEIRAGDSEIKAFFLSRKNAERFASAVKKALAKITGRKYFKAEIKEEFINYDNLFKV